MESPSFRPVSLPVRAGTSVDGALRIPSPDSIRLSQSAGASTSATHRAPQLKRASSEIVDPSIITPDAVSIPMQMASTSLPRHGDGLLHPSSASIAAGSPRGPTRRNTTGSSALTPMHRSPRPPPAGVAAIPPSSFGAYVYDDGKPGANGALDSDILKEAEQIRRERAKRALAQQEAEAEAKAEAGPSTGHARKTSLSGKSTKDANPNVLVGNLIGEDHVNYVLMYNMLTGIRIAVSDTSCRTSGMKGLPRLQGFTLPSEDKASTRRRRFHCTSQILF